MKKIIFLFSVTTIYISNCYSQEKVRVTFKDQNISSDKGYIAVSIGPCIPISDFASKLASNSAGLANTGAIFDLSYARKLGQNFGISILLRGQSNSTDGQAFADAMASQFPTISWRVESKSWSSGGLFAGGIGSFPINETASFDARFLIGFINASSPELKITGYTSSASISVKQSSASATAFSLLLGAGFKFNLSTSFCLLTYLDYMSSKPEFRNVAMTLSTGAVQSTAFSQNITTINIGFGIGMRL